MNNWPQDHLIRILGAAYKTPAITKFLVENKITPDLPYTLPKTKGEYIFENTNMFMMKKSRKILKAVGMSSIQLPVVFNLGFRYEVFLFFN
ncbi:hypothetical protein ACQKMD_11350 [Viridibacillus sp. NPDC096237]|uniref:hypothetical protein n=1 Tax=Viridibacillus sp. NPDC096237 TaxID=3390721 RepID=UPI003CFD7617